MSRPPWTDADREAAYQCFANAPSLRAAHKAFSGQVTRDGSRGAPTWLTYRRWAKQGKWDERKARVAEKAAEKTDETLATVRAKRAAQIGKAVDGYFGETPEDALKEAKAGEVAKFIELEDRLRGGEGPVDATLRIEVAWKPAPKEEASS